MSVLWLNLPISPTSPYFLPMVVPEHGVLRLRVQNNTIQIEKDDHYLESPLLIS